VISVASVKPLKQVKRYLDGDIKQSLSGKKNITAPLANPIEYGIIVTTAHLQGNYKRRYYYGIY
jgi:hypothetical protein